MAADVFGATPLSIAEQDNHCPAARLHYMLDTSSVSCTPQDPLDPMRPYGTRMGAEVTEKSVKEVIAPCGTVPQTLDQYIDR